MSSGDVTLGYLKRLSEGPHGLLAGQEKDDVDITGGTISGVTINGITGSITNSQLITNQALALPNFRAAVAKTRANVSHTRIMCIGDSTTLGVGSDPSNTVFKSYPGQLMLMLRAAGVVTDINTCFGNDSFQNSQFRASFDPRWTPGSGWATGFSSINSLGGNLLTAPNGSSGAGVFTPTEAVDTFDVYYAIDSTFGSFTLDIDGGTPQTVNSNGSKATGKATITAPLGIHSLNIRTATGIPGIIGMEAYNSAFKRIVFDNCGVSFVTAQGLAISNAGYQTLDALKFVAPALTIINAGINNWLAVQNSTSLSVYITAMQAIITAALTTGDVLIMTPNPSDIPPTADIQQAYVDAMKALATSNNVLLTDNFQRWVSYAISQPLGYYSDGVHPQSNGYTDEAVGLFDIIGPIAVAGGQPTVALPDAVVTSSTALTNTTTETSIVPPNSGTGNLTLPANFFVPGRVIRLRGGGIFSTSGTPGNLTIKLKFGATLAATAVITTLPATATNVAFQFETTTTCRTVGGSGSVMTDGKVEFTNGTETRGFQALNNTGATVAINTTIVKLVDVTAQWATASSSNSITLTSLVVEEIN